MRRQSQSHDVAGAYVGNCNYNGLAIIRELGRKGVPVMAVDCARSVGTYSRYARYLKVLNPLTDQSALISALIESGRQRPGRAVLFPTNDEWALAFATARSQLSEFFVCCVADLEVVQLLVDKERFYQYAARRGWSVPHTWPISRIDDIPSDAYPIIAKPKYRRTATNAKTHAEFCYRLDRLRLTTLQNRQEARQFTDGLGVLRESFILQELVPGLSDSMYSVGIYADGNHRIRGLFSGRKVRGYPPESGDCMVGECAHIPVEIKDFAHRFVKEMGYSGIAEMEFKRDARNGNFKLIEVNPRSWSWVGVTAACGVNLPWIAYRDLAGQNCPLYSDAELPDGSVKWVRILDDALNCLYKNGKAGYPAWKLSVRQWWRSLEADKLVVAEFTWDDPLPGMVAASRQLRQLGRTLIRKTRRRAQKVTVREQDSL